NWDAVQYSAGGYTIENTPYLFTDIKGDWFDILGLSLDPLRGVLRMYGVTDSKRPKLAGVFGYPISQSKSPTLHGYWLNQLNIPGFYTALECPPAYFADTVHLLAKLGFAGANVTMPHKDAAIALSDTQTKAATTIGVSNTLVFGKEGILADNTDGVGFWRNIQQSLPDYNIDGQTALVLGAGGAARAVIWALLDAGAAKVVITNRTRSKADALAQVFGERVAVLEWDDRSADLFDIGFVVNTTALGMTGKAPLGMDLTTLPATSVVTDIVYVPLETDLLAQAKTKGCPTVDGLGMLLHQAAPGFEAWFGTAPTVDTGLRKAVLG
ncbi:MAG: shikimate dehydrogenase, partial [Planktomarina sp.]